MFKVTILFISLGYFVSFSESQSTTPATSSSLKPEECANKVYNLIKTFKGSKADLMAKIEEQFNVDMKNLKATPVNADTVKNIVELVSKRIQKDDPITVDEFRKHAENLIMKWRASDKN